MEKSLETKKVDDETQGGVVTKKKRRRRRSLQAPGLIDESDDVLEKRAYITDQDEKDDDDKTISNKEEEKNVDSLKKLEEKNKEKTNTVKISKEVTSSEPKSEKKPPQTTEILPVSRDVKKLNTGSFNNIHETKFWFVFFLIIQLGIYFRYSFLRDPFFQASFTSVSEKSILRYKSILGVEPKVIEQIREVEVPVPVPPPKRTKIITKIIKDDSEIIEHMEDLTDVKEFFEDFQNDQDKLFNNVKEQLEEVKLKLLEKQQSLLVWKQTLEAAEREINELLDIPPQKVSIHNAVEALKKLNETSKTPIQAELVLANNVPMWKITSSSGCPQLPSSLKNDPIITEDDIQENIGNMKEDALKMVAEAEKDEELEKYIKEWVEKELVEVGIPEEDIDLEEVFDVVFEENAEEEVEDPKPPGMTKEGVENVITKRMEGNIAEKIGISDMASVFNGAKIIRTGTTRATSPSLTESLPLLNRFMAYTKLRFYGFDAEVALTPTAVSDNDDGDGQCWSFENASKSKNHRRKGAYENDQANGRFASLTIQLAKRVSPKRVVIEHLTSPIRGKRLSAVRDFRLIGYEDPHARGDPINLGSFVYHSAGGPSQEFRITEDSTMIGSITLAVDNAHRQDFACLYRFKVMEN
mmetsp:Transcript_18089/g.20853  ORF Transcript_18089/g.20853 Transcript_18089/m.20853 type:complete len:638 (+) Transcript_18089:61-1974(+)